MPRRDPDARRAYEERRKVQRRSPEYRALVNARIRQRYAEDPEYHARVRAYQKRWRTNGPTGKWRSTNVSWTPELEAEHAAKTVCEVCGKPPPKRGLFADHCHDCRAYRGALCHHCNANEGVLRKWQAVCPPGSPMRIYMDRHTCEVASEPAA